MTLSNSDQSIGFDPSFNMNAGAHASAHAGSQAASQIGSPIGSSLGSPVVPGTGHDAASNIDLPPGGGPIIIDGGADGGDGQYSAGYNPDLSLEGLEALLDRIFSADDIEPPHNKPVAFRMRRTRMRERFAPMSDNVGQLLSSLDLLRAQLDYANEEVKALKYRARWLELKVAARDDQLKHFPNLFEIALETAAIKAQSTEMAHENELLKGQLKEISQLQERVPLVRTVLQWLLKASRTDER